MTLIKNSKGFSLIEVLVTLLLTTIGVMGMVAMQAKAISYTKMSSNLTNATVLVSDLTELLRLNKEKLYEVNGQLKSESGYFKGKGSEFSDGTCNAYDAPADSDNPGAQLCLWVQAVKTGLPGITDEVLKDGFEITPDVANRTIQMTISWQGAGDECLNDNGQTDSCSYTYRVEI